MIIHSYTGGLLDPPMLRKIEASDGRRADGFEAEKDGGLGIHGGFSSSQSIERRVLDLDVDRSDSGPVLDLLDRLALRIRGGKLGYRCLLLWLSADDSVLRDVVE
jgi:hypothetical protein